MFGVVRLSRGALTHCGQASGHVLPSAMSREQPISLVRSRSASIEHRVAHRLAVWLSSATHQRRLRGALGTPGEILPPHDSTLHNQ